jgi:hypothetical protein
MEPESALTSSYWKVYIRSMGRRWKIMPTKTLPYLDIPE